MNKYILSLLVTGVGLWVCLFAAAPSGDTASVVVTEKPVPAGPAENEKTGAGGREEREVDRHACININSAGADELETLPRIGPVIAGRIIAYRKTHGKFSRLSDVDRVKGIGPATLRKIGDLICFE
jgi:competence protein ComEA